MKILVVDDDRINSTILSKLLTRDGHDVLTASNGRDGVALFEQEEPDLVLLDIRMPIMNGYEAAQRIKHHNPDRFVPLIFLTAVTDDEGLARCLEAGGDDFLTKPFNRIILQAKIGAMERIRQLHAMLRRQKEQLERHQDAVERELRIGNHLFAAIVRAGNLLDAPCLKYWTSPMFLFNGDLLVASYNPAGGLHILMGDFTGHGLSAAVGALPLAELFYGLTAQGYSVGDLAQEINAKLRSIMPTGMFCSACLIEVDHRQKSLMVWNGGLPEILIVDGTGRLVKTLPSTHLPLGVMDMTREDRKVEIIEMRDDYRVFLYSDGLNEAVNAQGEMFSLDRLKSHFEGVHAPADLFQHLLEVHQDFRGDALQSDDISLLEIDCSRAGEEPPGGKPQLKREKIPPAAWELSFSFSADTLKTVDPLPTIITAIMQLQAPAGHRERLYTLLAELYSNALDHGLLQLDTRTKNSPEGFIRYYTQREERLANLREGNIHIQLKHMPKSDGGAFYLRLQDSGPGFDPHTVCSSLEGNLQHGGRGIALVRSLCTQLVYNEVGNAVEAVYRWS
jgi:CheY-like chemotaxis protein/signal transduction histidine kinase